MNRSLLRDYSDSLRHPEFWVYATWLELASRYRRSRLGLFWAMLPPALYAFGIGGFFAHMQRQRMESFIPHMAIGYVIFRFITVALIEATTTCVGHASYILDGRVRLTDYVLRVIAKAAFYLVLSVPVVVVALWMAPGFQWISILFVLPALGVVLLNVAWMGVLMAVLGARLQDVNQLMGSVLMIGFLFTPIIWHADLTPADTSRGAIARMNPLFHMVEIVRAPLLGGQVEFMTYLYLAVLFVVGSGITILIYRRYARFVPLWV